MVLLLMFAVFFVFLPQGQVVEASEVIDIPDENLEEAIRDELNIPPDDITVTDMEELISLSAEERGIEDTSGLNYAVNLNFLNLNFNEISDITPLSGLEKLKLLYLQENYIDITEGSFAMGIINKFIYEGVDVTYKPQKDTETYEIVLLSEPEEGDEVEGEGTYIVGEELTVTAIPNESYEFVSWTENGTEVSTDSSFAFTVTVDRELVSNFTESEVSDPDLTTPSLTSPLHGEIVPGSSVELNWAPLAGITHYAVWIYKLTKDEEVINTAPMFETSYTHEGLADDGDIYAWSVVASDASEGTWGDFATPIAFINGSDDELFPATLTSPDHLGTITGTEVLLEWEASFGADFYTILVADLDTGEYLDGYDGSQLFSGTSHFVEGLSGGGTTYFWSVSAADSSVPGEWSDYAFPCCLLVNSLLFAIKIILNSKNIRMNKIINSKGF